MMPLPTLGGVDIMSPGRATFENLHYSRHPARFTPPTADLGCLASISSVLANAPAFPIRPVHAASGVAIASTSGCGAGKMPLADDRAEEPHQRLGRRDVRAVAGVDLEVVPARLGFEAGRELQEYVARPLPCAVDVA